MLDKKTFFLFTVAIGLIGFFLFTSYSYSSLATDSGFDTSYGGGSSGGSSGGFSGGSGGGSSSDYYYSGSNSGSRSLGIIDYIFNGIFILFFIAYVIFVLIGVYKSSKLLFISSVVFIIFTILAFIIDIGMGMIIGTLFYLIFKLIKLLVSKDKVPTHYNERAFRIYNAAKKNKPSLTKENEQILKDGYQIYLDIQKAWMNFDYDTLRLLITDELFNTYQNQMKTLELKGEKNVMDDFVFVSSELLKIENENGISTILMELEVEFYDYIINNQRKKVRGSKRHKVLMDYLLTFVKSEVEEKCPHCGAQLENGATICEYCHSHIQVATKRMKLSKKEVLSQRQKNSIF